MTTFVMFNIDDNHFHLQTTDVAEIAQLVADIENKRPRTVVITQGAEDVLVAFTGRAADFRRFKVFFKICHSILF